MSVSLYIINYSIVLDKCQQFFQNFFEYFAQWLDMANFAHITLTNECASQFPSQKQWYVLLMRQQTAIV